jgi:hypothetical protein
MRELPTFLNAFDIGLFLLRPTNFNYRFALPNKLFEFVQARLAIAVGPSPEMAAMVHQYGLGFVSDDFLPETLAHLIRNAGRGEILRFKQHSHDAARVLCAERARHTVLGLVSKLLEEPR